MGYYTSYSISVSDESKLNKVLKLLHNISDGEVPSDSAYFNAKWYDFEEHVYAVSKQVPNILITIEGEGEDNGDLWIEYWMNGKVCGGQAQIIYPEYKPSSLKEYESKDKIYPI